MRVYRVLYSTIMDRHVGLRLEYPAVLEGLDETTSRFPTNGTIRAQTRQQPTWSDCHGTTRNLYNPLQRR